MILCSTPHVHNVIATVQLDVYAVNGSCTHNTQTSAHLGCASMLVIFGLSDHDLGENCMQGVLISDNLFCLTQA